MSTKDSGRNKELSSTWVIALTTIMMLCVMGAYFYYERAYQAGFMAAQRDHVLAELNSVHSRLDNALNRNLQIPNTLSSYVLARGSITESEFQQLASQMLEDGGESIRSIQVTRGTIITYLYPMKGNERVAGIDLLALPGQADGVRQTISSKKMMLVGPLELIQGGSGLVIRKPIYIDQRNGGAALWGLATVVVDWPGLLQQAGVVSNDGQIDLAILNQGQDDSLGSQFFGENTVSHSNPVVREFMVPGGRWELMAIPHGGWKKLAPDTWFHRIGALFLMLAIGLFGAWRLAYPARLRRDVEEATKELQSIQNHLEQLVAERTHEVIESERLQRTLLDNIPFPLVVTQIDNGLVLYSNELATTLFDLPRGNAEQHSLDYYVNAEDRTVFINKLLSNGRVINHEVHMQARDGRKFFALLSAVRIHYNNCDAVLVSANDINERKRIELALKTSEENFRKIFEYVPTPTAITRTDDGQVLKLNPAAVTLFGVEDILQEKFFSVDFYENPEDRLRYLDIFHSEGGVKGFEVRMKDSKGNVYDTLMSSVPIQYAGQEASLVGLTDITLRKEAERRLHQANIEAENAVRAKSEFLAIMSHEIRTPLNGALTMLKVLERTDLTSQQRECVEAIGLSGESLLTILNDVLDLSKIEAGMLEIAPVSFEIRTLIAEMIMLMKPLAERSRLNLYCIVDESVPTSLVGDTTRIRQVLFNLLGNAIKFTEFGSVTLNVQHISGDDEHAVLKFLIHDTGIGIEPILQERLFTSFSQVDSSIARRYGGTGLGLAICRRLVEAMGGTIGVASEVNRGSTFWFSLRLTLVCNTMTHVNPRASAPISFIEKELKILLVEDNEINRRAGSALLSMEGCEVLTANDGLDALAVLETQTFDVVLMDIHMPGIDGLETTRRLRKMSSEMGLVPVIALTADITHENLQECFQVGMDAVLTKPINLAKLQEALRSADLVRMERNQTGKAG